MKIATFNENGIRSRLPNLLEWLRRKTPDIVCLQESEVVAGKPQMKTSPNGKGQWNDVQ